MTANDDDLDVPTILRLLEGVHADESSDPSEGLRERKKRRVRQRISDVATAMFLVHGFDNVTVAQIAEASEVSEQTAFNYFTTKESMFFDRSGSSIDAVADAVRERGNVSLVDAVLQSVAGQISPSRRDSLDEAVQLNLFRRFCDVAAESPALVAARFGDLPRFIEEVSIALAQRVGMKPIDPEVQLVTFVIAGLVRVRLQSTFHYAREATSFDALNDVVRHNVLKAAHLAEPSLTAFDNMRRDGVG